MSIKIIVGPPCSGKSTYVLNNKKTDDVRIDFDALAQALGASILHASEGNVRKCTYSVREQAIDWVIYHEATAFIIHSRPSEEKINRYLESGCEFILLDPGKEACLERCEEDDRPEQTKDEIESWYENPPTLPDTTVVITPQDKFVQRDRLERFANMLLKTG